MEKLESIVVTPQSQLDTLDEPIDYSMRKLPTPAHDPPTPKQSFHDRPASLCDPSTPSDLLTSAEDESTTSRDIATSTQHLPTSMHEMPTSADVLVESNKQNRSPSPIRDQSKSTQNPLSVPELPGTMHETPESTHDLLISKHRPNTTHTLSTPESDGGPQHNRVTHDLPTTALPQSTQRIQNYVSYQRVRPRNPRTPVNIHFHII